MPLKLTTAAVRKIFPGAPQAYIDALVSDQSALAKAGILETRQRLAYCFANVEHESGGFTIKNLTENINYTPSRAAEIWPSRFSSGAAVTKKYGTAPGWQLKMFDDVYGNRMGNRPGTRDGSRYIGRGACQHTGRDGYAEMEKRTGIQLVEFPELATKPENQPALIGAFWSWKGLNGPADAGDFNLVVRRWNGGQIGLADRKANLAGNDSAIKALEWVKTGTAEIPTKKLTPENATAGGIVAAGAGAAKVAHDSGASPSRVAFIVLAVVVVAIATFFAVRWLRRGK